MSACSARDPWNPPWESVYNSTKHIYIFSTVLYWQWIGPQKGTVVYKLILHKYCQRLFLTAIKVGTLLPYNCTPVFLLYFQWCNNPGQTLRLHKVSLLTEVIWGISKAMNFGMMAVDKDQKSAPVINISLD